MQFLFKVKNLSPNEAAAQAIQLFSQDARLCERHPNKMPRTQNQLVLPTSNSAQEQSESEKPKTPSAENPHTPSNDVKLSLCTESSSKNSKDTKASE